MSPRKPPLTLVGSGTTGPAPPRTLNPPGLALWGRIQAEYAIRDAGGVELLTLACEATDRASALAGAGGDQPTLLPGRPGDFTGSVVTPSRTSSRAASARAASSSRSAGCALMPLRVRMVTPSASIRDH